MIVIKI